ncbi:branched-chain amino acid ABC transporter permease [Candidatus Liberibacter americanus]|uniref:ABC-type branched-chain amino acid transport system, permease component n=1 Tax=Candidatus Liberibacter americanus str. Sao Paulo TaxID=1261131 RepID=U6B829_9HYPH|nr:branched-chain amino acid ABC transporter permease [Candidatus Liberibacter americanus]AHA27887.1 ABC-type branched-chain amino acid transport system, permease component [Candidatus Liberibacter americanus str. Sao Paulo]EMS36116.1 ABC transporter membrane spanning protein (branched chain amino acid) [Candidatus Liberibacter americanus PW_SP]
MSLFIPKVRFLKKNINNIWYSLFAIYPIAVVSFFNSSKAYRYIDGVGINILIYVILAWGLSILVGTTGLLSLNYIIAYAVGAYSYTILGIWYDISPLLLLPISALIAGLSGVILGLPSLILRGDLFALITFTMTEIFQTFLTQKKVLTGGKSGIYLPDHLMFLGLKIKRVMGFLNLPYSSLYFKIFLYYILLALCFLSVWIISKFRSSYTGSILRNIRDNHKSFFKFNTNVVSAKLSAFIVSSILAGACGALFATTHGFIAPKFFNNSESLIVLSFVILGGMTSFYRIAGVVIVLICSIEIFCGVNLLGTLLKFDCSVDVRHRTLMIVSLFLVVIVRSYSLSRLRHPSPFLESKR